MSIRFPLSPMLGLTIATSAFLTGVAQAETLSVVTFGGAYESAAKQAYFVPFTEKTKNNFTYESYDGGIAKLQAMVQAKNTSWDLIDLETNDAITACDEGLLQKFDKKTLGKTSDFIPGTISDCAVASMVWSTVYAYDTSKLKTAPTTVNDFFDLQKFPSKRGLRKSPKVTMEWALIADGVDPKDVYKVLATPAGVDRPAVERPAEDVAEDRDADERDAWPDQGEEGCEAEDGHGCALFFGGGGVEEDGLARGLEAATSQALHDAEEDELAEVGGCAAEGGTDGEERDGEEKIISAAKARGEIAGNGKDDGVGNKIRSQHPGRLILRGAEAAGNVRQGHVCNGGVKHLHERGKRDRHGDDPRIDARTPWLLYRRMRIGRWRVGEPRAGEFECRGRHALAY